MSFNSRTRLMFTAVLVNGLLAGCGKLGPAEYAAYSDRMTPGIFLEETREVIPRGVSVRKVFPPGLALTKVSEGFVNRAYNDAAGYCTIAYGHLIKKMRCQSFPVPSEFRGIITEPKGAEILQGDMTTAEYAVQKALNLEATDGQFAALVDFVFNVGAGNFQKSTLLKRVNARRFNEVPFELRRWTKAGGRTFPGLVTRREKEIALFFLGSRAPISRGQPTPDQTIDIRLGESPS